MANEKPGILNVRDTLQKQGKTSEEIKGALTTLFSAKDAKLAMASLPTPAPIAVPIVPPVPVTLDTIAPIVPPVPVSPTAISIEKETAKHQAKLERGQRVEENRKKEAAIKTGTLTKSPEAVENEKQVKLFNESLEKTNKKLKELNKDIEKTDKNFKDLGKTLEKRGTTKEGIERALGVTQKTKELGSIGANVKDFFSVRGFLDKTGIVKRGSGGIFDTALAGREHKIETLKTERQMGLDVDAEGNKLSKKEHVARYGKIQKEGRELSAAKAEKERILESTKMTEEGFAKTGVGEKLNAKIESRETMMRTLHPVLAMHHEKEEAEKLKLEEKKKPKTKQKKSNVLNVVIDEEESPGKQKKSRVKAIPKQAVEPLQPAAVEPLQPALVSKNSAAAIETADDQTRLFEEQNKLLKEIRDNTDILAGKAPTKVTPTATAEKTGPIGKGGQFLDNIGKGLKSLGAGLRGLGSGVGKGIQGMLKGIAEGIATFGKMNVLKGAGAMIVLAGALLVMGKALKEFNNIEFGSVLEGIAAMLGLAAVAKMMAKGTMDMIKGAGAMIILAGALYVTGKALQEFANIDWETLGKAAATLIGLGLAAAAFGAFAPIIGLGALAITGVGISLMALGKGLEMVAEPMDEFVDAMVRLGELDAGNIAKLGLALMSLAAGMTAFGTAQALAGLGSLVGRFLTMGADSPIEQLIKIGRSGEGVAKAADGIEKMSGAMERFSKIDKKSLEAINDFPWAKATAFAAAGGTMQVAGAKISNISEQNAAARDNASKGSAGGEGMTVVNAPTTNNKTSIVQMKRPERTTERSSNTVLSLTQGRNTVYL